MLAVMMLAGLDEASTSAISLSVLVFLCAANVACGVAICAMTHPGALAIFTRDGYVIMVGLWTTVIILIIPTALIGGALAFATGDVGALGGVAILAGAILVAHLVGLLAYALVGEFLVAAVLVIRARACHTPAPLDRLASGLLLTLVVVLGGASGLSWAANEQTGAIPRSEVLSHFLSSFTTFDGTPQQQLFGWIARIALVGIVACGVWLVVLYSRGRVARRSTRHNTHAPGRRAAD
jgi:hypothetical protein